MMKEINKSLMSSPPIPGEKLGDRLIRAMKQAGAKNPEVAKVANVDPATVSRWRSDRQSPSDSELKPVAEYLGVSAMWIRYGRGFMVDQLADPDDVLRPGGGRVSEGAELSGVLDILASEFELEAMKAGADKRDMRYIRMALRSREATEIYHGGYQEPATDHEQRTEMENTIAMLRLWLKGRIKRRKPTKKRS